MNIVQTAIANMRNSRSPKTGLSLTPEAAMIYCILLLLGGSGTKEQMREGAHTWCAGHGEPTWESLEAWAAGLKVDTWMIEAARGGPLL